MTGLVEGFRSAFLGKPFDLSGPVSSLAIGIALFVAGVAYFEKSSGGLPTSSEPAGEHAPPSARPRPLERVPSLTTPRNAIRHVLRPGQRPMPRCAACASYGMCRSRNDSDSCAT